MVDRPGLARLALGHLGRRHALVSDNAHPAHGTGRARQFAGLSVGGAYHDGETDSGAADKKDLGCHLLFRESFTLGWQLTEHHKIAAIFDHISNAKICDHNEGLENIGLRYSYRF